MGCGVSSSHRYEDEAPSQRCDSDAARDYFSAEALYSRSNGSLRSEPGALARWFRETSTVISARVNHGITRDADQFEVHDDECLSVRRVEQLNQRVCAWLDACRDALLPQPTTLAKSPGMASLIELTIPEEPGHANAVTGTSTTQLPSFVSVTTNTGQRRPSTDSAAAMSWPSFTFVSSTTEAPPTAAAAVGLANNTTVGLLKKTTPTTSKRLLRPPRLTVDVVAQHTAIVTKMNDTLHPSLRTVSIPLEMADVDA